MQQPANTSGVQVVVLDQTAPIDTQSKCRKTTSVLAQLFGLGATQIAIGILCIIFQIVSIAVVVYASSNFYGIWIGITFIISGAFGIKAGMNRSICQITTFNVLSILSAVFAAFLIIDAIPLAIIASPGRDGYSDYYDNFAVRRRLATAMEALLTILGVAEGIVAICSSVACCSIGACCCNCGGSCCCPTDPKYNQFHKPIDHDLEQQQQLISSNQQQPIFNPNQPQPMINPNQQPPMFNPNQPQPVFNPNQPQPMINPNQQPPMFNSNQPQPMFNPKQQQPVFNPNQQKPGFNSSQQAVHHNPDQRISQQPEISASPQGAAGQGLNAGSRNGLTAITITPPDNQGKIKPDEEEPFAHGYDFDAEYRY